MFNRDQNLRGISFTRNY